MGDVEYRHVAVVGAIHAFQARVAVQELLLGGERLVGHQRAAQAHPLAAAGLQGANLKLAVGGHLLVHILHFAGHDVESAVNDLRHAKGSHPWLVAVGRGDVEGSTLLEVGLHFLYVLLHLFQFYGLYFSGLVEFRLHLAVKYAALHDAVVGLVGAAVLGRVAQGILARPQHAVDERAVLRLVGQTELHAVDAAHHLAPPLLPRLHCGVACIGAAHKRVEQRLLAHRALLHGAQVHPHMLALGPARLVVGQHCGPLDGRGEFAVQIRLHRRAVANQVLRTHKVLKARLVEVNQPRLWMAAQLTIHKLSHVLCQHHAAQAGQHQCHHRLFHHRFVIFFRKITKKTASSRPCLKNFTPCCALKITASLKL